MNKRTPLPVLPPALTPAERAAILARHATELTADADRSARDLARSLTQRLHDLEQERLRYANDRIEALTDLIEHEELRSSGDLRRLLGIGSHGTAWPLWATALRAAERRQSK